MDQTVSIETSHDPRLAGALALAGSTLMLLGAGIWATTGTDIDRALMSGDVAGYLAAAAQQRPALVANLIAWIAGVLTLGAAGTAMAGVGTTPSPTRDFARFAYWTGTAVAVCAFTAWLALIVQGSGQPDPIRLAVAEVVAWFAYRADGIATALLVGAGPALVAAAGRADWAPRWLRAWGLLAALAGAVSFLPYLVPVAPLGLSLVIVPVGLGWTLAAAFTLMRG